MLPRMAADLPALDGTTRRFPDQTRLQELLVHEPGGHGEHLWVLARKEGLSTQQAAAAIARAAEIPVERVRSAAPRDRQALCEQWFSVPRDEVVSERSLQNAGYKRMLRVLRIVPHERPMSPGVIRGFLLHLRIKGAAAADGYQRARAIMDRLRTAGCPNYFGAARLGKGGQLAKWGRLLLQGKRLPPAVQRKGIAVGPCLAAIQAQLFNALVGARLAEGLLAQALPGDVLRGGCQLPPKDRETIVVSEADCATCDKRIASWEAVPLGPLFGEGMLAAAAVVAEREASLLAERKLTDSDLARLQGGRRAMRFQPREVEIQIDGADILIRCLCDEEVYASVLAEELVQPAGHLL